MTTRREVIAGGLAALGVPFIGKGEPVKSMLGANEPKGTESGWQNPYITDGLVAMWDGQWNAGGGVHDASATMWVDLSGNGYDITVPTGCFDNDGYDLSIQSQLPLMPSLTEATIEFVADIGTWANNIGGGFFIIKESSIAIARYNSIGIFSQRGYLWNDSQFILPSVYPKSIVVTFAPNQNKDAWFDGVQPQRTTEYWTSFPSSRIGCTYDTGRIRSIRIHSRVLTAEEIAYNYEIDAERFGM